MTVEHDNEGAPKSRRRAPQQQRSQQTLDTIRATAASLFNRSGLSDLTLAGIAREAGVSVGAVQFHFPTKNSLFRAVISDLLDAVIANEREMLEDVASTFPGLQSFLDTYVERYAIIMAQFHPNFLRVTDVISQDQHLSAKGREIGLQSEAMAKAALSQVTYRNGFVALDAHVDAVYHIIFSFLIRELHFPSGAAGSPEVRRRRQALSKMCYTYLASRPF